MEQNSTFNAHLVKYAASKPRVGQQIVYRGQPAGIVTSVEDALCWVSKDGAQSQPFIWCFKDGLNILHEWPTK